MVTVAEPLSDFKDLGPVVYQESKILDNEIHLLCVHDSREKKFVNFEAYSFETGKVSRIQWDYVNFDSHFRFNAELMNPNNREGRYHWVCERLNFVSDGKGGRKLELCEPTDDMPQVADRARNFKIPTGRMNYADRQRLRLEMERLPKKRVENIDRMAAEFKAAFVQEVTEMQEMDRKKAEIRAQRIEEERKVRYNEICEVRQAENMLKQDYGDKERKREQIIKNKDDARNAASLAEIRQLLKEHDVQRKATQVKVAEQRKAKKEEREETKRAAEERFATDQAAEDRRLENWEKREDRLEQKAIRLQAERASFLEGIERTEISRSERKKELAHDLQVIRQNLWAKASAKDEKRKADNKAALDALAQQKEHAKQAALLGMTKKKRERKSDARMDAVEAEMRQQLEAEGKQNENAKKRDSKFIRIEAKKNDREVQKVIGWKESKIEEAYAKQRERQEKAAQLAEAIKEKLAEEARSRDVQERKDKMRNMAQDRKLGERMRRLVPGFKSEGSVFRPQ
ncbi:unnamed protein product [Amoebophrya sp. A25]|nr:unnamed protein product [Amoebophrya sp. A25]|eukprot:GSA25T00016067001.1